MTRLPFLVACAILVPLSAQSACVDPDKELSCPMSKNRYLEVCAGTEAFSYSFGATEPPEMELIVPFSDGTVEPWIGAGSNFWSSVGFPNGEHEYRVWVDQERGGEAEPTAGIIISRKGKEIARLECKAGQVSGNPMMFEDAMTDAGYCHDASTSEWRTEGFCD